MSQNPVGLAIPPSEYDQELMMRMASINSLIINLEMIDNLILSQLANQKRARNRLIKNSQKLKER